MIMFLLNAKNGLHKYWYYPLSCLSLQCMIEPKMSEWFYINLALKALACNEQSLWARNENKIGIKVCSSSAGNSWRNNFASEKCHQIPRSEIFMNTRVKNSRKWNLTTIFLANVTLVNNQIYPSELFQIPMQPMANWNVPKTGRYV